MAQRNSINTEEKRPEEKEDVLQKYGSSDRYLYKENIERARSTTVEQAIGIKEQYAPSNPNDYIYSRTTEFPQPSIVGIGVVTAAGAVDTSRFFFSQLWTVTDPATLGFTGRYRINHNIGDNKYSVQISPVATTAFTANIAAYNNSYFEVRTFNAAGAATNCSFTFTVWMIP